MNCKMLASLANTALLGLLLAYACGENTVMAADDIDWSQVEMSIAMLRVGTSATHDPGNCEARCYASIPDRTSKVKLIFPDELQTLVEEKLGGELGTTYFYVSSNQDSSKPQKIYFDFDNKKPTLDGRSYIERSADRGKVTGAGCYSVPVSLFLKYVKFENTNGSKSISLYPQNSLEATSTLTGSSLCGGAYIQSAVKPLIDLDWSKVELSIAMIKTAKAISGAIHCNASCFPHNNYRTSKVKLTFPDGFQTLLENMLGEEVGSAYFFTHPSQDKSQHLKIYFDFHNTKTAEDGRLYFERSATDGEIKGTDGLGCYFKPDSILLDYVRFNNNDGSKFITFYPKNTLEATSNFSCQGRYNVPSPVVPHF